MYLRYLATYHGSTYGLQMILSADVCPSWLEFRKCDGDLREVSQFILFFEIGILPDNNPFEVR